MAAGYEKLGEPTSIVNGLVSLGRSIRDRREKEEALSLRKDQLNQQRQQQQSRMSASAMNNINSDYAFSKFATGDTDLDKILAPKLDEIKNKALGMINQGNIQEGMMYAGMATEQLGRVHVLASNAIKNANNSISILQKQDPNIDVNRLRSDVNRQISSQFVDADGNLADQNKLQQINIPDDLAGQLASTGNYYSSAAPAVAFFSDKKNMQPFEYASHNGLGGGQTIKGASSVYKPIEQDAKGNYVPTTASENVSIADGHTAQVMPNQLYENLPLSVKGGITYSYNKMASDPKSALYTTPSSPLYGATPTEMAHPATVDLAKRWVARSIADQVSPSYVNRQEQANRIFASQVTGGRSAGKSAASADSQSYYDAFSNIENTVGKDGGSVTVNNFSPSVQKYIGSILSSSGSGLANDQAAIKWDKGQDRYELVDNESGALIAPLSEVETNLKTNSAAQKTRSSILKNTPTEKPKGLSEEDIKKGLKHLGIGGRGQEPEKIDLSKLKKDKDGRIDLTSLYD